MNICCAQKNTYWSNEHTHLAKVSEQPVWGRAREVLQQLVLLLASPHELHDAVRHVDGECERTCAQDDRCCAVESLSIGKILDEDRVLRHPANITSICRHTIFQVFSMSKKTHVSYLFGKIWCSNLVFSPRSNPVLVGVFRLQPNSWPTSRDLGVYWTVYVCLMWMTRQTVYLEISMTKLTTCAVHVQKISNISTTK